MLAILSNRSNSPFDGNRFSIHPDDFYLGRESANSTACVAGVLSIGNGLPSNLGIIGVSKIL
jgi:hypothetical protein